MSLSGAPAEDDGIVGSLGQSADVPFAGAGVSEVDVFATPSVSYDDASGEVGGEAEAFGFAGESQAEAPAAEARRPARPGRADGAALEGETAVPTARRAPRVIVPPRFDSATVAAAAGGGGSGLGAVATRPGPATASTRVRARSGSTARA